MTSPAPGWYPDPSGQPGDRWWNGTSWSQDTRPATAAPAPAAPAAPAAPTGPPPTAWDGFGNPVAPPVPGATPPAYDPARPTYGSASTSGSTPPPYAGGPAGYGGARGGGQQRSFLARNGYSFGTVGVAVLYFLLLVYAHVAIIGILPLFLGIGAVRRREPLGYPAVAIGVIAIVVGIYEYTR